MTADMFGGLHQNDERTRARAIRCEQKKQKRQQVKSVPQTPCCAERTGVAASTENQCETLLTRPTSLDMSPSFRPEFPPSFRRRRSAFDGKWSFPTASTQFTGAAMVALMETS